MVAAADRVGLGGVQPVGDLRHELCTLYLHAVLNGYFPLICTIAARASVRTSSTLSWSIAATSGKVLSASRTDLPKARTTAIRTRYSLSCNAAWRACVACLEGLLRGVFDGVLQRVFEVLALQVTDLPQQIGDQGPHAGMRVVQQFGDQRHRRLPLRRNHGQGGGGRNAHRRILVGQALRQRPDGLSRRLADSAQGIGGLPPHVPAPDRPAVRWPPRRRPFGPDRIRPGSWRPRCAALRSPPVAVVRSRFRPGRRRPLCERPGSDPVAGRPVPGPPSPPRADLPQGIGRRLPYRRFARPCSSPSRAGTAIFRVRTEVPQMNGGPQPRSPAGIGQQLDESRHNHFGRRVRGGHRWLWDGTTG